MKKLLLLFFIASYLQVHSQDVIIQGNSLPLNPEYSIKFNAYEMYEIDVEAVRNQITNSARSAINIDLKLGSKSHLLQLNKYAVIKPECKIRIGTANGIIETSPDPSIETYRGYNANFGGGYVTLTVAKNFLSIMFKEGEETYYLEQVPNEFKNRNLNHFVLYDSKGYKITEKINCSAEEVEVLKTKQQHSIDLNTSRNQRCWEMEIALAADNAYFVTYGSSSANVQARLTNLVNLMQADWLVPVALSDYIWSISDFYIAEDLPHDPFKTATNCNDLRNLLAGAALGGIFQGGFDIAIVWTTRFRNCQYSASQSGMCTFSPFAACSEFTQAIGVLRCLQSHTIGHTMSAVHDGGGSPTIMSANITGASSWSNQSQFDIYAWAYFIRGCLVDCSGNIIPIAEFKADPVEGCLPLVVKFTNMSTNGTSYKWSFPGGTPSISIDKDPIIVYNSAGTFNVELVVINPKCSTKLEKINYIYVKDKPKNVFFNFGAANNGNEIEFFGYADRADTYKWKFPDNTTDEGDYVTHIFPKEGSFQIELCATNDCGTTCVKQIVSNYYTPIADFTSDTTNGCAPTTIKFFDKSSTNVIAWTWSFPGGTPNGSYIKNPTVKYTRPGVYQVKLVVNSIKNNAQIVKDTFITIDSLPLAQFDPIIIGSNVTFNNLSLYAKKNFWDFGDGSTSTQFSPMHDYKDGRYEVKYTASNACGSTVVKKILTIGAKPVAGFSVLNQKGCIPFTVQFQNTSTATAKFFEWTFSGGVPSTSTDKNPIVTYYNVGKFDVKLVAKGTLESDSVTQTQFITVQEGPQSDFKNSISGFISSFTNLSKNANTYYWDFGDNKSSTEISPSHNYGVEGEFKVLLITENECGIDTMEKLVAVYLIPKVNFSVDTIRGCAPFKVQFRDKSSVDVLDWSWQFESGVPATSSLKDPIVTFYKAGKYTIKLSVKNSNGTNSATKLKYIEVISPVKCPRKPPKKTGTGAYQEGFSVEDQIFSRSRTEYETSILPNPATDELFIQARIGTKYTLINLTGNMLIKGTVESNTEKIDVSKYTVGTYFLKIDHEDYNEVIKIVINR